jgi:rhamnogalacturonan endolyase
MRRLRLFVLTLGLILSFAEWTSAQSQPENLRRGLVAVSTPSGGIYLGWRLLASDPETVSFNVYRGATKINDEPLSSSTNFFDPEGTTNDSYSVVSVVGGVEQGRSEAVTPWSQNYLSIPLQRPAGGTTPDGVNYTYSPNDCSVGDLDGDGEYETVLKWDPSNAKDNSQSGYTGNVYLDGLEMDGTLLWRIDLGRNIRAGAHYTQFMVYDLDGDGKAELACKTADGTVDGVGTVIGDTNADYRNSAGYILSGPEFFTIFSGETGEALQTVDYLPARGNVSSWGDSYGNRVDRFLAGIAYLDGIRPSVVMCRGYYTRAVLVAWDWRDGQLTHRWTFDSDDGTPGNLAYRGQGNHQLSVADVDDDGKDEIIYGSCVIDDDGTGLWSSGLGHGDAMHVSDIDPTRPGLEVWGIHENARVGSALLDARTGQVIWGTGPADVGRGVAANVDDSVDGVECWGGTDGLRSARNARVGNTPPSANHVVWWDGDLARELLDSNNIRKYGGSHPYLLIANGCLSNNGTKANPSLQADLFGDWREEVMWRTSDNSSLRIYTTTDTTRYRLVTLMHDRTYRLAIAWQNVAYNQPPHTGYFIGAGMFLPDSLRPPSVPIGIEAIAWSDSVKIVWSPNADPDLLGYNIYRSRQQNGPFAKLNLELLLDTSYTDTDVVNDSTYYYAVTAVDWDDNESVFSDIVEATPTIRPAAPSGLSARNDLNSVLLIWDSVNLSHVLWVNIYRSETAGRGYRSLGSRPKTLTTYRDSGLSTGQTYYYKITVVDTNRVESFYSEEVSATPGPSFTMQAEDANIGGVVYIENNHLGYHGTGFANFEANGSSVEFTYMPGFGGGERTLIFRYALGNTNRTGSLIINGVAQNLTMESTGAWTNYRLDSVAVTLNPGYNNTIRFQTTGSDFGNLDEITILSAPVTSVALQDLQSGVPLRYQLYQNYPNPFNPTTNITYTVKQRERVKLAVYNVLGKEVATLLDKTQNPGEYTITFNANGLTSGIYYYRLQTKTQTITRKMVLLK